MRSKSSQELIAEYQIAIDSMHNELYSLTGYDQAFNWNLANKNKWADLYHAQGLEFVQLGLLPKATECFINALRCSDSNPLHHRNLGLIFYQQGHLLASVKNLGTYKGMAVGTTLEEDSFNLYNEVCIAIDQCNSSATSSDITCNDDKSSAVSSSAAASVCSSEPQEEPQTKPSAAAIAEPKLGGWVAREHKRKAAEITSELEV